MCTWRSCADLVTVGSTDDFWFGTTSSKTMGSYSSVRVSSVLVGALSNGKRNIPYLDNINVGCCCVIVLL